MEKMKRETWDVLLFFPPIRLCPVDILQGKIPRLYRKFTNF
jgi:hypothetical protein